MQSARVLSWTTTTERAGERRRYRDGVGFNPFRSRVERRTDAVVVAAALVVILALVLWGVFGG